MAVEIVRYDDAHGPLLVAGLREVDRRELYMLTRLEPADALALTLSMSVATWTALEDGEVICVFGISRRSPLSNVGVPWLVGTDLIYRHWRRFAKQSRDFYDRFAAVFPEMENFVLAENTPTVRWLSWLGFDMDEPEPMGFSRAPFIRFSKGMN